MYPIKKILLFTLFIGNFSKIVSNEMVEADTYEKLDKNVSYCEKLQRKLKPKVKRYFYIYGKFSNVTIMWGRRSPSRVAGALLLTALRHNLGYQGITFEPGSRNLSELADVVNSHPNYEKVIIHMGVEIGADPSKRSPESSDINYMTTTRLVPLETLVTPITLQLHALLSAEAQNNPECSNANVWTWYRNFTATTKCGFKVDLPVELSIEHNDSLIPVLVPFDSNLNMTYDEVAKLVENVNKTRLPWRIIPFCNESDLRKFIEECNSSILFMDYDIWKDYNNVIYVQPPLSDFKVEARRVEDAIVIEQQAPPIRTIFHHQHVNSKEIYEILKLEANGLSIEEAACAYTLKDTENFKTWADINDDIFKIVVLVCKNEVDILDGDLLRYFKLMRNYLRKRYENVKPKLKLDLINCTDVGDLTKALHELQKNTDFFGVIGVLAKGEGTVAATKHALTSETLVFLYGVPSVNTLLNDAVRTALGTSYSLAKALIYFTKSNGWKRVAVLSDSSQFALDFEDLLSQELVIKSRTLSQNSSSSVDKELNELLKENGRIFFVNTDFTTAQSVICKAMEMGLTPAAGYAWIVREWENEVATCHYTEDMEHFTLTYSWQGIEDDNLVQDAKIKLLRQSISKIWNNSVPTMIAPLTDALILLTHTVASGLQNYPQLRYDLQGNGSVWHFSQAFMKSSAAVGISQELKQSKFAVDAPLVFVNAWKGMRRKPLAIWRVNDTQVKELKHYEKAYAYGTPPDDGTKPCLHKNGDAFSPSCHDGYWAILCIFILVSPGAVWVARKVRKDALAAYYKSLSLKLLARCDHVAGALADHLIDRSALDMKSELGTGHFGRVCSGTLTLPNKPPMSVAVKALKDNANRVEEAEFLREACALAALSHEHIIGFVGVCADSGGPPLLLMKNAFFGDLQRYLYKRRSLVHLDGVEEAKAVSARELTRLAREAAEALSYLAEKRFVHRDIRAANCLVDENRNLKLADFGLARSIGSESSDSLAADDKYLSKRRGVFAVAWMAPEAVLDGVFSHASDVWSLGVLMLEIVSLGEKPYGVWKPPTILKFVYQGGHPPLPTDVNYHTSELLLQCWSILPGSRPSAATVAARLRLHPTTLQPALRPACPKDSWLFTPADDQMRISTL